MPENNQVTLEEALQIAQKYHQEGNLTLADQTYRDIAKSIPGNYVSMFYLAMISYQRGNMGEGIEFIKQAVEADESQHDAWNLYGVILACENKDEEAVGKWNKAIELKPDLHQAHSNKGNSFWKMKRFDEALEACQKAVDLAPDFADSYINLGIALAALDKHEDAIDAWQKALELNPLHPNAFVNIGNAMRDIGRIKESEEYTRRALKLTPDNPQAQLNLGNVLRDLGQYDESEEAYRKSIAIKPDYIDAHNNLAILLNDMFRYDEAITSARYAIAFDASRWQAHTNLAHALRETGRLVEAEAAARQSLILKPDYIEGKIDLADVLFLSDRYAEAETILKAVLEETPDDARVYLKLAAVLERANKIDAALETINKAIEMSPEMPEAHYRKALIYYMSNQIEEALDTLDKTLKLEPKYLAALGTKSEVLQTSGDMEGSLQAVRQALEINDKMPSLLYSLSKLKKFESKDDPDFQKLLKAQEGVEKLGKPQATSLNFAMFKASEDIKDFENSFQYLEKGNALKRSTVVFDRGVQDLTYKNYIKTYNKEFIDSFDNVGHKTNAPIFIVGMPRSGTTLTEQIISSHPDVFGAGELYYLGEAEKDIGALKPDNAKEIGERYMELARSIDPDAKGAKKITDKMPGNYMRMGQIVAALPNAKIIHTRRNPMDTCLSCFKQLFARGHYWSYDLEEMAEHYDLYIDMMNHWREIMPEKFIEIDYEETVGNFEAQARKIIDYVDLDWNDACLTPHKTKRSILTASKGQVRKPVYKTSVEAWRRYEKELAPLAEALDKHMGPYKK